MENSGFFDAKLVGGTYDRQYLASAFAKYFSMFIGNGVFTNLDSSSLLVTSDETGMRVNVGAGYAWINGYWYENLSDTILNIDVADGVFPRIDLIVLRYDIEERTIQLKVLKGTTASSPVEPSYTRDANYYDLVLARIDITAGMTKIYQTSITDYRLVKPQCGAVVALVDQIDTTAYGAQLNNFIQEYKAKADTDYGVYQENCEQWVAQIQSIFTDADIAVLLEKCNQVLKYNQYTYIVDSNQALLDWGNNKDGNNYSHVLIKVGEWAIDSPIDLLVTGTVLVTGEVGSVINCSLSGTESQQAVLFQNSGDNDIIFERVTVSTSGSYLTVFEGITELKCCSVIGNDNPGTIGFSQCTNLMQCITKGVNVAYAKCENVLEERLKALDTSSFVPQNLLPYPYITGDLPGRTGSTIVAGVTITLNEGGSITLDGTSTTDFRFDVLTGLEFEVGQSYVLSGCPIGGSTDSYYLRIYDKNDGTLVNVSNDIGEGVIYTPTSEEHTGTVVAIMVQSGVTLDGVTFKPMLIKGEAVRPYTPYDLSNVALRDTKASSTVFGRVKLSDSSAVTESEGLALPATEKNASIDGTLANQISALNSSLAPDISDESYVTVTKTITVSASTQTYVNADLFTLPDNVTDLFIKHVIAGTIGAYKRAVKNDLTFVLDYSLNRGIYAWNTSAKTLKLSYFYNNSANTTLTISIKYKVG